MAPGSAERRSAPKTRVIFYVIFLIFCAPVLYLFLFRGGVPFQVPSGSMEPTLAPGDYIFTLTYPSYHRGDIVVLRDPLERSGYLVKRIVGIGGDSITVENGALLIHDKYASEPYIAEPIDYILGPIEVPPDEILVLGDNRNWSDDASRWVIDAETGEAQETKPGDTPPVDGHTWKRTVPVSSIIGRVVYRYLPFGRIGPIRSFPLTNTDGQ